VKVLSNGTIHAGGEGSTFITTKDSGRTWSVQVLSSTKVSRINGISFPVLDTGWLCSSTGDIYKTTNGGKSFTSVHQFPGRDCGDIVVPFSTNIVVCADSGRIIRSSDGGATWNVIQTPVTVQLYSITFLDSAVGFACGDNGVVLKTINGGAKWAQVSIGGSTANLRGIQSRNDTIVISAAGALFVSGNRGDTFGSIGTPEVGGSYNSIVFAGNKTLYTGTNLGKAYRSTNFGSSWTVMPSKTGSTNWLFGCDASSPTFAAFVGRAGTAMVTQSGKDSLRQNPNFTSETFRVVQRAGRTIFAGGLGGVMFRSTDNGDTWKSLTLPSGVQTMSCIKMVSTRTIVVAGAAGKINFSSDAGETWTGQTYSTSRFWGIDVKGNLGLAVNTVGNVYRSTNSGLSWTLASSLGNIYLYSVSIVDSMTAYLCTGQQAFQIYKTTDAGTTWSPVFNALTNLFSIYFVNSTNGVAVGDKGQVFVTYDAGTTWLNQHQDSLIDFRTVTWYDKTIVAAGLSGVILRSTDNGETFQPMNSPTGSSIFAVDMAAPVNGTHYIMVAGESGNLFRYSYSTTDVTAKNIIPGSFSLSQNYPNPFNPSTTIEYSIPNIDARQKITLKVYDVLGHEVGTLVNGEKVAGRYSVPFNARSLSSGMYFYRLTVGGHSIVKKMLLMK
ncbi:MAG: YCF48-related protein, partial [Bacteroidota bacterium]